MIEIILTKEQILEFQRIYLKSYGREISIEQAESIAYSLIRFVDLIVNKTNDILEE